MTGSESSSSDEESFTNALKEATDHQFLKESFFVPKNSDSTKDIDTEADDKSKLKSLRKNVEQEKFEYSGLTPELQKFVAKKLHKMLDASIHSECKEEIQSRQRKKRRKERDCFGVKLLNTSSNFLTTDEEIEDIKIKQPKMNKKVAESEADNILKCQEVAVDPEWILSKEDTKAWTNKWNNREFKYRKLKNGVLIEQAQ